MVLGIHGISWNKFPERKERLLCMKHRIGTFFPHPGRFSLELFGNLLLILPACTFPLPVYWHLCFAKIIHVSPLREKPKMSITSHGVVHVALDTTESSPSSVPSWCPPQHALTLQPQSLHLLGPYSSGHCKVCCPETSRSVLDTMLSERPFFP